MTAALVVYVLATVHTTLLLRAFDHPTTPRPLREHVFAGLIWPVVLVLGLVVEAFVVLVEWDEKRAARGSR